MSDFNHIGIGDFAGAEQDVGGLVIDSVFHATALPINGIVAETGDFTLTSTPTVITLVGVENLMLIDLGTNDTNDTITVELQFRTGGDWIPANVLPASQFDLLPRLNGNIGRGISIRNFFDEPSSRVSYVPCLGAVAMRLSLGFDTLAGVRVKHLIGTPPYTQSVVAHQTTLMSCYGYPAFTAAYAADECMAGTQALEASFNTSTIYNLTAPKVQSLAFSDQGAGVGDLDVIIAQAGDNSPLADGAPFDLDSPYAVLGWYEVRATPTGNQIPLRDFGSGGMGCLLQNLNLQAAYTNNDAGSIYMVDIFLINRAGAITPTPGGGLIQVMVEF